MILWLSKGSYLKKERLKSKKEGCVDVILQMKERNSIPRVQNQPKHIYFPHKYDCAVSFKNVSDFSVGSKENSEKVSLEILDRMLVKAQYASANFTILK